MSEKFSNRKLLQPLQPNQDVRLQPVRPHAENWQKGKIVDKMSNSSYVVETENGTQLRRNRQHIRIDHEKDPTIATPSNEPLENSTPVATTEKPAEKTDDGTVSTRSGRIVRKPSRYGY